MGRSSQREQHTHCYPRYWRHAKQDYIFVDLISSAWIVDTVQRLVSNTFLDKVTRDRRSRMPARIDVVKVWRIEIAALWRSYREAQSQMLSRLGKAPSWESEGCAPPKTSAASLIPQVMKDTLCKESNEVYLFHGTSPQGAAGITQFGFDNERADSAASSHRKRLRKHFEENITNLYKSTAILRFRAPK